MDTLPTIKQQVRRSLVHLMNKAMYPLYLLRGRRPWTRGYMVAKEGLIARAIDEKLFQDASPPRGYGFRLDERVIEYPWLFTRLSEAPTRFLDAGSALNFGYLLSRAPLSKKHVTIATLHPERNCYWNRNVSYVFGDLREPYFADSSFDEIACISTIEHVGLDNTKLYTPDETKRELYGAGAENVLREFHRILRPGGKLFLTFPFGKAAIRGWFQVFDLNAVERMVAAFAPSSQTRFFYGYYGDCWNRVECEDLVDASFYDVHSDTCCESDFLAAARGVCCLELVK